ncbi:DUF3278 domain-containing protein [Ligilactobacillus sp. WILCCON 0076]|uniref:DUF3278 domain-containing protein n=1 Tax=Ligilactobacillus ubinensis TaxID=2876789 RepID=A0A9X2FQZ4_9LACO|nr:DUF3278 domain-containing protein [Ligilactobacillus ubinensis]MCP0887976.1 DUF3278 domain-containing protein [Ligilactobacillus ubinensis]
MYRPNKLMLKIIKLFYGVEGVLDEYKLQQIDRIGNNAFLILFSYTIVSNLFVSFVSLNDSQMTLSIFILVNILFSLVVVVGYIAIAMKRLNLNNQEVIAENYSQKLNRIKRRALRRGAMMTIYFWCVERFLDWYFYHIPYIIGILSFRGYLKALIAGSILGVFMYIYWRSQLKKISD